MESLRLLAIVLTGLAPPGDASPFPLSCREAAQPHVFEAWTAMAHARFEPARDELALALKEDPNCVLARAMLGTLLVGPRGERQFALAWSKRETLLPLERLELERLDAQRRGELEKAFKLASRMAKDAPKSLFAQLALAHAAQAVERWDESALAARRAIKLAPRNGAGWNLLGYAHLRADRLVESVAAFKGYVNVSPFEPNASDSLGEALLEAQQYDDAELAFREALTRSNGTFTSAWSGLAAVHAHRGEWSKARAALASQRKDATQHVERLRTEVAVAWTWAAEGKFETALQTARALEKEASSAGLEPVAAEASLLRAQLELVAGRPANALQAYEAAAKWKSARMTPRQQLEHRLQVLTGVTVSQARLGRVHEAQRALVTLKSFLREELPGPLAGDSLVFAYGAVAQARRRPRDAIESWLNCSPGFALCRLSLLELQERAGDKSAAAETRAAMLDATKRDPRSWFVRARLDAKRRISGT